MSQDIQKQFGVIIPVGSALCVPCRKKHKKKVDDSESWLRQEESEKNLRATDLITEQENFGFTPRVTHGSAHNSGEAQSSSELGLVLECPEPACARTFRSVEEMEKYLSVGQHTESMYDTQTRLG
ncbi:unnamed protein product [Porites evermanni]|uniref:C2H2-type domain-containing protein n=1 Tax=Porites evermanni TaxID=104178 RepID=A0ABN8RH81_9CNID|nr:unnamed protein product [Porites evermanni]